MDLCKLQKSEHMSLSAHLIKIFQILVYKRLIDIHNVNIYCEINKIICCYKLLTLSIQGRAFYKRIRCK